MANVTATDGFFVDPRYDAAALHLGLPPEVVRLRCLELYSWQTEHFTIEAPTYEVSPAVVVGKLKHLGAPAALVAAGLAEERPGGLYIKGSRGRIEWLEGKRGEKVAGGRKRVDGAPRDARGRLLPRSPAGGPAGDSAGHGVSSSTSYPPATVQQAPAGPPAAAPAAPADPGSGIRDLGSGEEEGEGTTSPSPPTGQLPLSGASDPEAKTKRSRPNRKPVETPIPEDFTPNETARALAAELRLDLADQVARWRDKAAAKGWRWADHQAALRTWLRNAAEFRARDARQAPAPAPAPFGATPTDPGRRVITPPAPIRRREPLPLSSVPAGGVR